MDDKKDDIIDAEPERQHTAIAFQSFKLQQNNHQGINKYNIWFFGVFCLSVQSSLS